MIIWAIPLAVAVGVAVLLASSYAPRHRQHGAGTSALNVRHLVERIDSESSSGDDHKPRIPITMSGDLFDDIADEQTRILPLLPEVLSAEPDEIARNPLLLQRVLAGVRRL